MKYYAVREGKIPGIYNTWDECSKQVTGFKGAVYKKFDSYEKALNFIEDNEVRSAIVEENIKEDEIIAYVDGSFCVESNIYSYGVVLITSNGKETFNGYGTKPDMAEMRNVSGELKGAMEAMEIAVSRNKKKLYLHFDYAGIEKWAMGEWKTNKLGTKLYKEYYDKMKKKIDIVFIKVKAHSGIEYNEEADLLAKRAIKEIKEI